MSTHTPASDPVLADFELPLHGVYHPLGFSVEIETNSQAVLAAAQKSWGCFRKCFSEPAVTLQIGVLEGGSQECPPAPVCRSRRNLMVRIADAHNYSVSDMARGFSFSWLTPAVEQNRAYLRYHFVEGMAWDLLDSLYLTSIHGACVSKEGRGVLLCGDSAAGKSTLSFACARAGWTFLSDDSTCLVRSRKGRVVVGNPHQIRFRESAVQLFPELKDQSLTLRATGEFAIEAPTASFRNIKTTSQCSVDFIVFLNRATSDPPGFVPFPKDKVLDLLGQTACYGAQQVRDAQKTSLRNLLAAEVFELRYRDMNSALDLLDGLVRNGAAPSAELCVELNEGEHA